MSICRIWKILRSGRMLSIEPSSTSSRTQPHSKERHRKIHRQKKNERLVRNELRRRRDASKETS